MLVNPSDGILGVATGKSSDQPGEAAVILYVDENRTVERAGHGRRRAHSWRFPPRPARWPSDLRRRRRAQRQASRCRLRRLSQAIAVKQQVAASLMRQNPAFFGVGVGQSLDNPREAALVIYVDRNGSGAICPRPSTACARATS